MKLIIDDINIDVIINKKNIKNIYFRIKEDLKLYVSCNCLCSDSYIEKLLLKNKNDILKMYNSMKDKINTNNEIYYLGNKMNYIKSNNFLIDGLNIYGPSIEYINEYLEKTSIKVFLNRLNNLKIMFNDLPDFKLRIRKMKTRWGVYNRANHTVTLNSELIKYDMQDLDYVIIHELCHIIHFDHSKDFWNLVSLYCSNYKQIRKDLRE